VLKITYKFITVLTLYISSSNQQLYYTAIWVKKYFFILTLQLCSISAAANQQP